MKLYKQSSRKNPKISLILLDWSVRESFHLLHYLSKQTVDRNLFEVILIEYYSTLSEAAQRFEEQIDTWVMLEMPESCYYHKHLMYNVGIAYSKGEICVICDSDAMAKPTFIQTIIEEFNKDPNIVLHLDQFRNMRRDFYPFNYPSFDEVLGRGCINNVDGKTKGIFDLEDPLHTRNYGACMGVQRKNLLAIGGADEHIDYLGHICGPYDMTFRLINNGLQEIWHETEFLYHTWHPGQAGVDNYLGPHDGQHMSTTALEAIITRRQYPYTENQAIKQLCQDSNTIINPEQLIDANYTTLFDRNNLNNLTSQTVDKGKSKYIQNYLGFKLTQTHDKYHALSLNGHKSYEADTLKDLKNQIRKSFPLNNLVKNQTIKHILFIMMLAYSLYKQVLSLVINENKRFFEKVYNNIRPESIQNKAKKILKKLIFFKQSLAINKSPAIENLLYAKYYLNQQQLKYRLILDKENYFLKTLIKFRLLPYFPSTFITNHEELKKILLEKETIKLIIPKNFYVKHYSIFASSTKQKDIIIV